MTGPNFLPSHVLLALLERDGDYDPDIDAYVHVTVADGRPELDGTETDAVVTLTRPRLNGGPTDRPESFIVTVRRVGENQPETAAITAGHVTAIRDEAHARFQAWLADAHEELRNA